MVLRWLYGGVALFAVALGLWNWHLMGELDEHKARVALLEQETRLFKVSLNGLSEWTAATDKVLEEHRLTVKKQEAAFRKLQSQVRAAYDDKDTAEWGRVLLPAALRILLSGKPSAPGD